MRPRVLPHLIPNRSAAFRDRRLDYSFSRRTFENVMAANVRFPPKADIWHRLGSISLGSTVLWFNPRRGGCSARIPILCDVAAETGGPRALVLDRSPVHRLDRPHRRHR